MVLPPGDSIQTDFFAQLAPGKNSCAPEPIVSALGLENLVTPAVFLIPSAALSKPVVIIKLTRRAPSNPYLPAILAGHSHA